MKLVILAAVVACCAWLSAAQGGVYCGRRLSEALATLCWGPEEHKRSWWVHPVGALAGMRGKRGPVDECCDKSCTLDELMTYC